MKRLYLKFAPRRLTALVLAVFLAAQFGLAGHLHADDGLVGDCLQCQFDHGHAADIAGSCAPDFPTGVFFSARRLTAPHIVACYRLPARGPPDIS
jgi:hypothetical protein